MYAVDVTPLRAAPPLQVQPSTAERNASPVFSDEEASPQLPNSTTASESMSVSAIKAAAPLHARTTFARTNLTTLPRAPTAQAHRDGPSAVSPLQPTAIATPSRPAPSPVRSLLDFYLGTSPSPRHSVDDGQTHSPTASPRGRRSREEQQHPSPSDPAASHSSASASSETSHRSPVPTRSYLDEFLAADTDDAYALHGAAVVHYPAGSVNDFGSKQPVTPGRLRVVGVAMDNSPVLPQMWEETSSSSSFVSSVSASSAVKTAASDDEGSRCAAVEAAEDIHPDQKPVNRPAVGSAESSRPLPRPTLVEGALHTSVSETFVPPQAVPMQAKTEGESPNVGEQPTVERELLFPATQKEKHDLTSQPRQATAVLSSSFSPWKLRSTSPEASPPSSGAAGQSSVVHGSGVTATPNSAQPLLVPPSPAAPYARAASLETANSHGRTVSVPFQTFTALSSLRRRQNTQTDTGEARESLLRARQDFSARRPQWAFPAEATPASAQPMLPERSEVFSKHATQEIADVQNRRRRSADVNPSTQRSSQYAVVSPEVMHGDPATAAAPIVRRPRSVVARLYPSAMSHSAPAHSNSPTHSAGKTAQQQTHAEGPRWNASTKICDNVLTQSGEVADTREEKLQRSRSCGRADSAEERPGARPRLRSESAHPSPAPPPLHTRTSLLRLQATSARRAQEAAELEEELHPTFHPELAPNSMRICREKLRALTVEAAGEKSDDDTTQKPQRESTPAAPTLIAPDTIDNECNKKALLIDGSLSSRQGKQKLSPRGTPSDNVTTRVGDRLHAEAAQRRQRQERRKQAYECETEAQEQAARQERKTTLQHHQTTSTPVSSSVPAIHPAGEQRSQNQILKEPSCAANTQSPLVSRRTAEKENMGLQPILLPASLPCKSTAADAPVAGSPLPRVDLYSSTEADPIAEEAAGASVQRQRVEERLLAFAEERRRRLYRMRHHADTHDATTGQRLFRPFTGR
ncbi:hypothetical protein ABB37_03339 [Leptomonas pyrrhocoris]|uniref:Uncharacterized protein n=1 Tax=Leptomonas pyrrhocoris TaxID=157538 RepID=A0A0N0VFZ3_LEPPY|nr:hypothetical protein ABB37_03339 [Leptomonas pyrrhocoris]KPA82221.1 hypothetical protein ABB37_03339 [Leptomonas pyrrhocoris]|eukprot:XP_015660660.1 hypothetical protein ABB37_03339 [Leptomonas pyrrhocoris]